jgi:hypothetical protein
MRFWGGIRSEFVPPASLPAFSSTILLLAACKIAPHSSPQPLIQSIAPAAFLALGFPRGRKSRQGRRRYETYFFAVGGNKPFRRRYIAAIE